MMTRRRLIQGLAGAAATRLVPSALAQKGATMVDGSHLPRWRGFNLLEKFTEQHHSAFSEWDFAHIAQWGFDFVRLPMSYRCWASGHPEHWLELDEASLAQVDRAVELGRQYGVHVNLNLHRAPGYCVNPPPEPLSLWADDRALDACAFHWGHLAQRYRGISNQHLTFDLLNEPGMIEEAVYVSVVERLVEAIHEQDPARLVIADGLAWGRNPVRGLAGLGVAQSTRGYDPMEISHYRASWIGGSDQWPAPTWPLRRGDGSVCDRDWLRRERIQPWKDLEATEVGVHVGEWGAFNRTPHSVVLAWMKDCLELWQEAGWGWALWNFRGSFGLLDSGRDDVAYEDVDGHRLDRAMLELLRAH